MQKGSCWNIWDLHVHTPHSALNNQYGDPSTEKTWKNYVTRLEQASLQYGVVAIGVTDYFTIEGYTRLLSYQRKGRLRNILLIPNIEFRIDKVIYREKDATNPKRLNLHVLLSPLISPDEIREHFLDDLDFVHEQEPFQAANTRKLKRSNLTAFGVTLQNQHEKFRGRDPFEIGCLNAVVSAEMIKQRLDIRFRGNYLLVLAEESLPLLDWDSQHHGIRKQLLQMSHAIFSSNDKTRAFCLGFNHPSPSEFIKEFKSLKPCLWGSDAHAYDERFLYPDENRFCWIKGDVTWEGLKQTLFEPSERVAIQETCPEATKSIFTLKGLTLPDTMIRNSLRIAPSNLSLNPNLVAIIGGRGAGKTALLDLIASCFPEGHKLPTIETSFIHRLYVEEPPPGEEPSQPISITLDLASGDIFTKHVGSDDTCFDTADIVYLTQNHFDEYSANPDKLNDHIIDLVFEHFTEEKRKLVSLKEALQANDRQLEEYNLQIEHLSDVVTQRKSQELDQLKVLQGSKADIEQRIAEIETTQGKQADEAKTLSEELDCLLSKDRAIASARNLLNQIKATIDTFLGQYSMSATLVNAGLTRVNETLEEGHIQLLPTELEELVIVQNTIDRDLDELSTETTKVEENLLKTRERIDELDGLDKLLAEHRQTLSDIQIQIEDTNERITETANNERRLSSLVDSCIRTFANAMSLTVELRAFLQSTIEKFRAGSPRALENILFDAVIDLKDYPAYLQNLALQLDNRVYSEADLEKILKPIVEKIVNNLNRSAAAEDFLADSLALYSSLKSLKTKKSVTVSDYGNAIFRRFFRVGIALEYNGKRMVDLSMGERAIILLKVLLALGDNPLLIDQPEEHLDNRFVFDDLAPAFREAKKKRQILIATHNANLVVNTDAEQVIIADNNAGVLSYTLGSLEDLDIRDAIKTILEGGDEAFRKREQRYGYIF